jgi:hypothetical protein
MAKRKMTNNDLQNITQKTADRAAQIPQETSGDLRSSGRVGIPVPHVESVNNDRQ